MKTFRARGSAFASGFAVAPAAMLMASASSFAEAPPAQTSTDARRDVELTLTATVEKPPEGAKIVDLWVPVARDEDGQKVSSVKVIYPEGGEIGTEPKFGNKMWHKRFEAPFSEDAASLGARLAFEIHRTEIVIPEAKSLAPLPKKAPAAAIYLEPNVNIPLDFDPIKTTAARLGLAHDPPIVAAKKAYDYLIDEFTYNWKAPGAGKGDVRWACDSKTGDCTDYNSTFLALCRFVGIPADHHFGFPVRSNNPEGVIPSWHCWAEFQVEGVGWIPIDPSEADKHPELREYNFGSQAAGMMKFTHGRDVTLVPPQAGPPLNVFIQPYAEVDGRPFGGVKLVVKYKNIPAGS